MTCVDEGVIMHVRGIENLSVKVCDPITQLVATRGNEAALFSVQGIGDGKHSIAVVVVLGHIRRLHAEYE